MGWPFEEGRTGQLFCSYWYQLGSRMGFFSVRQAGLAGLAQLHACVWDLPLRCLGLPFFTCVILKEGGLRCFSRAQRFKKMIMKAACYSLSLGVRQCFFHFLSAKVSHEVIPDLSSRKIARTSTRGNSNDL